ncbi:MAG: sugar nucleotide-binding protein [Candidatus Moraniibacteriota bacterium]
MTFFIDEPESVFRGQAIDAVILTAKIEFIENSTLLQQSMQRFLQFFKLARVVYISSDGIFDGVKGEYTESDDPNPVTLYGRNLALCENLVRQYAKNHCIIRPSYLYGFVGGRLDERLSTACEAIGRDEELLLENVGDRYQQNTVRYFINSVKTISDGYICKGATI